ncbi:MAG: dehydrogenase, partial [Bacteroidetes bacterium]
VIWKTAIPLPGQNSPVIWGEKLFFKGANESKQEVYCLNRETGEIIWTTSVGTGAKKPAVSGDTGYAAPSAATDGKNVYAIFASGDIAAIDMDGNKTWEKDLGLPDNQYGHSSSLIIAGGRLIVQYDHRGSQKLMALSTSTGNTIWSTNRDVKISWTSPIVVYTGSRTEIMTVAEPYVISYAPASGKELWKMECISGEVGPSLAYANGMVFSVNDYSMLAAIKLGDQPTILWEKYEYLSDIPSPVATDKYLFLATTYGVFACYDAQTGEKYWEYEVGTNVFASPMLVRGKLYLLDTSGRMHILRADKELGVINKPALGEFSACTPIFTDERIYLKGVNNIYCIGK